MLGLGQVTRYYLTECEKERERERRPHSAITIVGLVYAKRVDEYLDSTASQNDLRRRGLRNIFLSAEITHWPDAYACAYRMTDHTGIIATGIIA